MADHHIEVMFTEEEVDRRIQEIGDQITKDYEGKQVHLSGILKGSIFFICYGNRFVKRFKYTFQISNVVYEVVHNI